MVSSFFITKTIREKIKILYEEGVCVTSIRYYKHKINLFLLNGYYVEVFYNHKLDYIDKIQLLDSDHTRMKFYCDQIKIQALV